MPGTAARNVFQHSRCLTGLSDDASGRVWCLFVASVCPSWLPSSSASGFFSLVDPVPVADPPSAEQSPCEEEEDRDERSRDKEVIERCAFVLAPRVESHGDQYGVSRFDRPVATVCSVRVIRRFSPIRLASVAAMAFALSACGGVAPEVADGSDPALFEGRTVWTGRCASCHGASGGGGRGPKLNEGRVVDRFPEVSRQEALILNGRGAMPSFAGRLSDEQISSVTRYTREVLTVASAG